MAYDSLVLRSCIENIKSELLDAKINKIHQPDEHTVILRYRSRQSSGKLLLCAHPVNGRLHKTAAAKENPAKAPLFLMVLRKWLDGARITDISSTCGERVAQISFCAKNELGDEVYLRLIIEIMGKHSNIILVDENDIILDGIRRYSSHLSRYREVLPGKKYLPPPPMNKLPPAPTEQELAAALYTVPEMNIVKALSSSIKGISPLLAKNIPLICGLAPEITCDSLGEYEISLLHRTLQEIQQIPGSGGSSVIIFDNEIPVDYYVMPLPAWQEYGRETYADINEAVDQYFIRKESLEMLEKETGKLDKTLRQQEERLSKKILIQQEDLDKSEAADAYKEAADLLAANMYYLKKGMDTVNLPSFEDPDKILDIPLDPAKSPQENIQYYYKKYNKAKKSRHLIAEQLDANRSSLEYLQSIRQTLADCADMSELAIIEKEAASAGFCRPPQPGNKTAAAPLPPRRYISADGFTILIGRNNKQNDRLSLKQAAPDDIFLHTQKIPGSHTIIVSNGASVPESTILEAAAYAAWFSRARESGKTAVDYTAAANLKKPNGAVPGFVTYSEHNTVYVEPRKPEATEEE